MDDIEVIHILHHGWAFCPQPGIPAEWPDGHRWVDKDRGFDELPRHAREKLCRLCVRALALTLVAGFFDNNYDKAMVWFEIPNPNLGGLRPEDMLKLGRGDKLVRWIKFRLSGSADIMVENS